MKWFVLITASIVVVGVIVAVALLIGLALEADQDE